MVSEIYKPPAAEITESPDGKTSNRVAALYAGLAFFLAPLLSTLITVSIYVVAENDAIQGSMHAISLYIFWLIVAYVFTLVFALPLHWLLGQSAWRYWYNYFFGGLFVTSILALLVGLAGQPMILIQLCGFGALCSVMFWFFAVRLYER